MRLQSLTGIFLFAMASLALAQAPGSVIPGRYIVELKKDAVPGRVIAAHGVAADFVYTAAVKGFAGNIPPGQLKKLQDDPAVVSIVPDRVVAAYGKPAPQPAPGEALPAGVARIGATPVAGGLTGTGVGVAVVDTGLDNHRDLTIGSLSFTAYGSTALDNNGHGTHVGGIIAANDNTVDVVGVAPGATLYAVKVLDAAGNGTDATIIAGLNWIASNASSVIPPIRVVNMSLGRSGTLGDNPSMRAAVQALYNMGIAVVVAAGNDPALVVAQNVPAAYPEVFAVASTTAKNGVSASRFPTIAMDTASYFTTDGAFADGIGVTISAPGEDQENVSKAGFIQPVGILSTKLGGGTTRMYGTSMAAPHVSGVVARYFQSFYEATPARIEAVRLDIRTRAFSKNSAPLNSPTNSYSFDGEREGVVQVP